MKFNTHYEREKQKPEENHNPSMCNRLGYIPLHIKIQNLLNAGKRLQEYQEAYDFHNGEIDENYYATTRAKNFDLADATQIMQNLDNKKRQADLKREAVLKASKKAVEESKTQKQGEIPLEKQPEKG